MAFGTIASEQKHNRLIAKNPQSTKHSQALAQSSERKLQRTILKFLNDRRQIINSRDARDDVTWLSALN